MLHDSNKTVSDKVGAIQPLVSGHLARTILPYFGRHLEGVDCDS